jgi:Zn-dependent protease
LPELTPVQQILIWLIPILLAITLHEAAHGYVAYRYGDDTAKKAGRITLNPFKHIDLVGTIIVPVILMMTTNFIFGWAKPVPVDIRKLHNPKRDMALVAIAGPLANLFMALLWMIAVKIGAELIKSKTIAGVPLLLMGQAGVLINLVLMVLNLIPIPPLDGSRIMTFLLPDPWDRRYNQMHPMVGIMLVIVLISTGILGKILNPAVLFLQKSLLTLFAVV